MQRDKRLRVERIKFTSGKTAEAEPFELISPGRVVLIVGPNNSGKTVALRELHELLGPLKVHQATVVEEIDIECTYSKEELWRMLEDLYPLEYDEKHCVLGRYNPQERETQHVDIRIGNVDNAWNDFTNRGADTNLREHYLQHQRQYIRAVDRLQIFQRKELGNIRKRPRNFLEHLMYNRDLRKAVREMIYRVFNLHFVIDQLSDKYQVRLGSESISLDDEERRSPLMDPILSRMPLIESCGDGLKAFTAIISLVLTSGYRFIFIDDPEAYLHPPIARRLGSELMKIVKERDGQLFVSTHSSEFVQGCLESSSDLSIVRLTYDQTSGKSTARQIPPTSLTNILYDRLLRSTGVFDALFHRAAVIVESETDKVFYDEVNRRLVEAGRGSNDTLFISAQNWQTTGEIASPLRKVGIPAAIIIDVDVLRGKSSYWKHIWEACQVPEKIQNQLRKTRDSIMIEVPSDNERKKKMFKRKGLQFLSKETRQKAEDTIANLKEYGIFVVPVGELESWLPVLGIETKKKSVWVRRAFEEMGATEDAPNYMKPSNDDVWAFIDETAKWINTSLE